MNIYINSLFNNNYSLKYKFWYEYSEYQEELTFGKYYYLDFFRNLDTYKQLATKSFFTYPLYFFANYYDNADFHSLVSANKTAPIYPASFMDNDSFCYCYFVCSGYFGK